MTRLFLVVSADSSDQEEVNVSRPVHTEIELLFDVAGAAGTGHHNKIGSVCSGIGVPVGPVCERSFDSGDFEQGNVDIGDETRHPWPTRAMMENHAATLGQAPVCTGDTQLEPGVPELVLLPASFRNVVTDPLHACRRECRRHTRGGKVVPCHERPDSVSRGDTNYRSRHTVATHWTVDHGINGLCSRPEQGDWVFGLDVGQTFGDFWRLWEVSGHHGLSDPGEERITIHGSTSTTL